MVFSSRKNDDDVQAKRTLHHFPRIESRTFSLSRGGGWHSLPVQQKARVNSSFTGGRQNWPSTEHG
jgi:hypothetical protein